MRRAYLCPSSNHSNGVHQNLPVLNFPRVCSNASSSVLPVRDLLCLCLPSSKGHPYDCWRKHFQNYVVLVIVVLCVGMFVSVKCICWCICEVSSCVPAWISTATIYLPSVSFFLSFLVALPAWFYYVVIKLCTTSFGCSTGSAMAWTPLVSWKIVLACSSQ